MLTATTEVEVPTDLVWRLLAGQHLPHGELTEGDGAFPPATAARMSGAGPARDELGRAGVGFCIAGDQVTGG